MKKKVLALVLAMTMVFSMAACGSEKAPAAEAPAAEEEAPAAEEEAPAAEEEAPATDAATSDDPWAAWADVDTSEHVVINYMTTCDVPTSTANTDMLAELNAYLTEKINAEIQIYYIGWTDYLSNYNLTLAQMDGTVDLVGTATDWLDAWPNAKSGAFLELPEEMLQTYAPKTWASVKPEIWEMCKFEGDIYLMPEDNYAQWVNHGFIYRLDWAKEAGLADGCHSWADMTTYFSYIKETYPEVTPWNSKGDVQLAGAYINSYTDYVGIDGIATSAMWGGTTDDPYTLYNPYLTETELLVEFGTLMKEWDSIGVWKTDVLNNTSADCRADFKIGLSGADQHHTQTWRGLCSPKDTTNTIFQTDEDCEVGFFYWGEENGNVVAMNPTHGAMAVSAASKNPERALMVYDMIRNDQYCYNLFNYGQEGRGYIVNEEGYRENPEGYDPDNDAIATSFWWGRNDDLEIKSANINWEVVDPLEAELKEIASDYAYGQFIADTTNISSYINTCNEICSTYMKQLTYGKYNSTPEEFVAEFQAALEAAGASIVTEELQRQIDEIYK